MNQVKDEYLVNDPYEVDLDEYFHKQRLFNTLLVLGKLGKNKHILDVGCGRGYFTKEFTINNNTVLGIDYSTNAIEYAKEKNFGERIDYQVLDVKDLIEMQQKYDIIVANNLIEHIGDLDLFISNCHQLTNNDGYLIISTPNILSLKNRLDWWLKGNITYRHKNHVCEYMEPQMRNLLKKNNFDLFSVIPQYQIKNKKGLIYTIGNLVNHTIQILKITSWASTYFYLSKKVE